MEINISANEFLSDYKLSFEIDLRDRVYKTRYRYLQPSVSNLSREMNPIPLNVKISNRFPRCARDVVTLFRQSVFARLVTGGEGKKCL